MNLFLFSFSCENNGEENGKQEFDAVEYPLTTVKAKPTIDRKNYIVVFFPRTKSYSWVDMHATYSSNRGLSFATCQWNSS
jgi:hypothetical protein